MKFETQKKISQHIERSLQLLQGYGNYDIMTLQNVVKECIRLFKSEDTTNEQRSAAKYILKHVQKAFELYMSVDTILVRHLQDRVQFSRQRITGSGRMIALIGRRASTTFSELEGLQNYIHIRADVRESGQESVFNVVLQYDISAGQGQRKDVDVELEYAVNQDNIHIKSLFFDVNIPTDCNDAINKWLDTKSPNMNDNTPELYDDEGLSALENKRRRIKQINAYKLKRNQTPVLTVGIVWLKVCILLQEVCKIKTMTLVDESQRRIRFHDMKLILSHRLYTSTYERKFLYLSEGFKPCIGDQQSMFRRVAYKQYKGANEAQKRAELIGPSLDYTKRADNFLGRPVTWLFDIPPRSQEDEHSLRSASENTNISDHERKESAFRLSSIEIHRQIFNPKAQLSLSENLHMCGIAHKRIKNEKSPTTSISINVGMDSWLNNPIELDEE